MNSPQFQDWTCWAHLVEICPVALLHASPASCHACNNCSLLLLTGKPNHRGNMCLLQGTASQVCRINAPFRRKSLCDATLHISASTLDCWPRAKNGVTSRPNAWVCMELLAKKRLDANSLPKACQARTQRWEGDRKGRDAKLAYAPALHVHCGSWWTIAKPTRYSTFGCLAEEGGSYLWKLNVEMTDTHGHHLFGEVKGSPGAHCGPWKWKHRI